MRKVIVVLKVLAAAAFGWHAIGLLFPFYFVERDGVRKLIGYLPAPAVVPPGYAPSSVWGFLFVLLYLSLMLSASILFFRFVLREGKESVGRFLGNLLPAVIITPIAWVGIEIAVIYIVNILGLAGPRVWDARAIPDWVFPYSVNILCLVIYRSLPTSPKQEKKEDDQPYNNW